jgi:subtilisin family serine protease
MRRTPLAVAVALGALSAAITLTPSVRAQRASRFDRETVNGREVVAREVLVKFRGPIPPSELLDVATLTDTQSVERIGTAGTLRLRSRTRSAAALAQALSRHPNVLYAEPNFVIQLAATPDDSSFTELWGLDRIAAIPAWDLTVGSTAHVVGVIDTGIDFTHPDLAANVWSAPTPFSVTVGNDVIHCGVGSHGFNAITRQCNPMDDHNHGTHVAGTIGAVGNNGIGVAGVNWTTQLMAMKFLDDQGSGTTADAIAAIEFAIGVKQVFQATGAANVRVLSASWGGPDFSQALLDQVNAANAADMLFVAAAGNNGSNNDILPFYPAAFDAPNMVTVAATSFGDGLAYYSNYGASSVHLAAPGDFILSTTIGNSYGYSSGTSMAAPHVSGAAALVLSYCALDTAALKDTLLGAVDYRPSLTGRTVTGGRVNVNSATHACTAPPAAPSGLTATGADSRITLTWPSVPGAMRYNVRRSLTTGGPYTLLASDVKATTYIDTAVTNGTTYYYVVSAENNLGESADSNEASAIPNIPPDLAISVFTVPASGAAGGTVSVTDTTTNQGGGPAAATTTRYFLSTNTDLDAADTPLDGVRTISALGPGASSSGTTILTLPTPLTPATYYIFAKADADGVVSESFEDNNVRWRNVQIGGDLIVSSMTVPGEAAPGAIISVTDTTTNQGAGAVSASVMRFYLSTNKSLDGGDTPLTGSRQIPALAATSSSSGSSSVTLPSGLATGVYYVIGHADGDSAVSETIETNNTASRAITIGGDLVLSAFSAPSAGAAGGSIVVTDTVRNDGAAPVGASTTRFYLSTNSALEAGDTLLAGSRGVSGLAAGASSSGSTTVVLPTPLAAATYYIIGKADGDDAVAETSESNNGFVRTIQIGSDLIVSAFTVPAAAAPGAAIDVTDTVTNQGASAGPASVTRFFLSANTSLEGSDTLLSGSRAVPAIAAGASSSGSASLTLPSGLASQTYYVIAQADADNTIGETNETNNTIARAIQIGGDLVVSTLTVPATGGIGAPLTLSETTTNQGGGAVGPSTTKFYLSTNTTLDSSDTWLGGRSVLDLAGGAASSGVTTIVIPSSVAAGTYYVIAKADADAGVAETNESNNSFVRGVTIGSDLVVVVPSATLKAEAGAPVDFTDTVTNQGGGPATPSVTRYYLSTNSTLSADDVVIGGGRAVPALQGGASSAGSTSILIPGGTVPGLWYVIAKADGDNTVSETSESNNTRSRAVSIGPDLLVSTTSVPGTAVAGSVITVGDTVLNSGSGGAQPTVTRFYLSTNTSLDAADVALGPGRTVPGIAAGASNAGTSAVTIPLATTAGAYYLLVKADGDNVVPESSEVNNVSVRSLQVLPAP